MNKGLFAYCQKHLRVAGRFKSSASFKKLATLGIGYIEGDYFYFDEQAQQHLIALVAAEHPSVHLFRDPYPMAQTRTEMARVQRNEKTHALKVSEDFILLNSLDTLRLNQQVTALSSLSSLGQYVAASEIESVQHQQIVLVENLIVMANLRELQLPESLQGALWVYRGDQQAQQQVGSAYTFFRRFQQEHQLICFSDFDPAGLKIALTCGAEQWLTIADAQDLNIVLAGHEGEWFEQTRERAYLQHSAALTAPLSALLSHMNHKQKTLKQEHMLAHSLKLALYPLTA